MGCNVIFFLGYRVRKKKIDLQIQRLEREAGIMRDFLATDLEKIADKHEDDSTRWSEIKYGLDRQYDEVDNAWKSIELLPATLVAHLDEARDELRYILGVNSEMKGKSDVAKWRLVNLHRHAEAPVDECQEIHRQRPYEIAKLRPLIR